MKIIVCSDSHGAFTAGEQVLEREKDAVAIIFLGDGAEEWSDLHEIYPQLPFMQCEVTATGAAIGLQSGWWSWAGTGFFVPMDICMG